MKITNKNVDKVYNALLKHFNIDDFFFSNDSGCIYAIAENHKLYLLTKDYDVELTFNWYNLCDSPTLFYIESTFPKNFSTKLLFQLFGEKAVKIKQMFVKKIIDVLAKNDIMLTCYQKEYHRIPKISSREELMIKADLEL